MSVLSRLKIWLLLPLLLVTLPLSAQERATGPLGSAFVDDEGILWLRASDGWHRRTAGLPTTGVYPFEEPRAVRLTSVSTTADGLYLVTSGRELFRGRPGAWESLAGRDELGTYAYLTGAASHPWRNQTIAVGTSFHGLFLSRDGGDHWEDLSSRLPSLIRGAGYMEEISSLAFHPNGRDLYLLADFGRTLWRVDLSEESRAPAVSVALPAELRRGRRLHLSHDGVLLLTGEKEHAHSRSAYELHAEGWTLRGEEPLPGRPVTPSEAELRRREIAGGKRGIYVPVLQARGAALERHIAFAKRNDINAFVIDFKDDSGRITFDANLPMTRETGARRAFFDLDRLVRRLHEEGIYLIGRVVVFKDEQLHAYQNGRYAIRDRYSGDVWGVPLPSREVDGELLEATLREHWVDPYSREVWEYNVSIAEELQRRGVDEIQFDYIRFPSDGPVSRMSFPHRRESMGKEEALQSFLTLARERISIPIGVDVFGFNGYYEMDYLGQNISLISRYVDVISPMFYPSHFAEEFLGDLPYLERARAIYRRGTDRARLIADDHALIRPYVQAFLIGGELRMEEPEYKTYLQEQLEGTQEGSGDGYLLWNFSGRYYMVE
jgi:hypothetical protein